MPGENEYREERFRPEPGSYHQAMNLVADDWLPSIVARLGASHGLVLLTVERLVIGFSFRVRRLPVAKVAKMSGLGRNRVGEILTDLETAGVISLRGRGRGKQPFLEVNLDRTLSEESLAAAARLQSDRVKRKRPPKVEDMSSPGGNTESEDLPSLDGNSIAFPGGQSSQNQLPSPVGNDLPSAVGNKKQIDKKAVSRGLPVPLFSLEELEPEPLDKKEKKERNPTPHPSSSSSVKEKETRPTDDDYEKQAKRKAELVALGEDAPREEKGSEEELEDWRELEWKAMAIPPNECDWFSGLFAIQFAERLSLQDKAEKLKQVHEWVVRQNGGDASRLVWLVAYRCQSEQEQGNVRYPWPHFLTSVVTEWNDTIRHLPGPYTQEVLSARVEAEETAHALGVLESIPGWPKNSEKEVSAIAVKCLWSAEYICHEVWESYKEYVEWIDGLQNAKIEARHAEALEHLEWFIDHYAEYIKGLEYTRDGRMEESARAAL